MATTKKPAAAAATPAVDLNSASKLVQQAVDRALKAKELQPRIKGPIFCGIIYNPISKKLEIVNQFE